MYKLCVYSRHRRCSNRILYLVVGVVYRSPNIDQEEDVKLQKAIREVSKGGVIMGDFHHTWSYTMGIIRECWR